VQEVPSSATEVGRPEQALNTRRSAAGGVTAARAASPHLARPFDLTAHADERLRRERSTTVRLACRRIDEDGQFSGAFL